jgi:predicted nucleic acid-binding protein
MVGVDSSALIPLARVGRLVRIPAVFDEIWTTSHVREEVLMEGKRGTAALSSFSEKVSVREPPADACEVATLEGIAAADARLILLADERDAILLANDKGLIEVARSHGVECWWVTTLLLESAKNGDLTGPAAADVLYELVEAGMNMSPRVYSQVQRRLQELDG